MSVSYRIARQSDIKFILQLEQEWADEGITHGYQIDMPDKLSSKMSDLFWVAEDEDGIIGFIVASVRKADGLTVMHDGQKYIEIEDVFVSKEYRHQGVGSQLINLVLEEGRKKGIDRAMVYSASKDLDGIVSFYRKHGFDTWYVQMFK